MQALILAGGLGTRLGSITKEIPKPMVPVADKPFLEWLLVHLKSYGVKDFVFLVGYKSEIIQEHFETGRNWGCRIDYAVEKELLGTGGAILNAASLIRNEFLLVSGDNYLQLDFASYLEQFQNYNAIGQLACWNNQPPLYRSNVKLNEKTKRISSYDFHESGDKNFVDIGFKIFRKELLNHFPENKTAFSLELDVLPKLAMDGQLVGFPVDHPNCDVGTLEGLEQTRHQLTQKRPA